MTQVELDCLLIYGTARQGDYLRYATNVGNIEGEPLALLRNDGRSISIARRDRSRVVRLSRHDFRPGAPAATDGALQTNVSSPQHFSLQVSQMTIWQCPT